MKANLRTIVLLVIGLSSSALAEPQTSIQKNSSQIVERESSKVNTCVESRSQSGATCLYNPMRYDGSSPLPARLQNI